MVVFFNGDEGKKSKREEEVLTQAIFQQTIDTSRSVAGKISFHLSVSA
jgi:hypothetical protein